MEISSLFKWKSSPSRILCCGLFSLISVSSVLGARTKCTQYLHKEHELGEHELEGGTGNQTGEMIGRNVTHRGEKIKGTYSIYRGKVGCRMEGKTFVSKENNREVMMN